MKTPSKNIVFPVIAFLGTMTGLYFGSKLISKTVKNNQQANESNDLDSPDPKVKLAAQLAARALSAMDGSWNGTDSDELNRVAVLIHNQGSSFFKLVSDSYKKLSKGGNLYNDIKDESSSGEFARFLRCLNTGKFEPDSNFDGVKGLIGLY